MTAFYVTQVVGLELYFEQLHCGSVSSASSIVLYALWLFALLSFRAFGAFSRICL